MIKINNISKSFGKLKALDNVSFTVGDNECCALLGFNGAGKTTLINILTTTLEPSSGTADILDYSLSKDKAEIKKYINISPQEPAFGKNLTVYENIDLIADLYNVKNKTEKIETVLEEFGLTEKRDQLAKKLSGGQKKRLSIAMAVITSPKILFLDEPTLGLDVKSRRALWEKIKALKEKMTIFLTTHYLDEVETLTDRIAIIDKGRLKAIGTAEEIKKLCLTDTLEDAFLKIVEVEE